MDTLIVPVGKEGFQKVFISEGCWYPVRLSSDKIGNIKYIAAYRSSPISAITHYAEVAKILPYGEPNRFRIVFSKKPKSLNAIPYGNAPKAAMMSPRYTNFELLTRAKTLSDLLTIRRNSAGDRHASIPF